MNKLDIAIIGLGRGERVFLSNLINSNLYNLKAICSKAEEKLAIIKNKYPEHNFNTYSDSNELFKKAHSSSKCNTAMLKEYLSRCFVI